jgi:hypothetical protein
MSLMYIQYIVLILILIKFNLLSLLCRLKHQILPTLIAMCANNSTNIRVLRSELSTTLLTDYLVRIMEKDNKNAAANNSSTSTAVALIGGSSSSSTSGGRTSSTNTTTTTSTTTTSTTTTSSSSTVDGFDAVQDMKDRIPRALWTLLIEQLQVA